MFIMCAYFLLTISSDNVTQFDIMLGYRHLCTYNVFVNCNKKMGAITRMKRCAKAGPISMCIATNFKNKMVFTKPFLKMHIEYTSVKLAGQSRTGLWKPYLQSIIYQKYFPVTWRKMPPKPASIIYFFMEKFFVPLSR